MFVTASKVTRVELDADRVIATGTIRINSIIVANATAGAIEARFLNTAGTEVLSIAVVAGGSELWTGPAIFDGGFRVVSVSSAAVSVTVAHSADGA